jgi:hypothetical protein
MVRLGSNGFHILNGLKQMVACVMESTRLACECTGARLRVPALIGKTVDLKHIASPR